VSAEPDSPSGAISAEQAAAQQATAEHAAAQPAAAEPTPTVPSGQQTASHPAGSAMPDGGVPVTERPEVLVGGAFAGGLLAALLLRKIVG
jgi:pyruvate/2-oxoglutarate dehydrogenase complex dihydrolipoamide acyltransferase (E2) component